MGSVRGWTRGARATLGGGTVAAVVAAGLLAPAQAAPVAAAPDCPAIMPQSQATVGTVGEGLTVTTGSTPQPFKVEVLGVIDDGIGADHDLIMIKVSDLPGRSVVAQGGGIWAGMSGSPVYVNGKLLGAVSYGFTLAPSPIGGLTPAADMADVLRLSGSAAARAENPAAAKAGPVALSAATRRSLARRAAVGTPSGSLAPLVTPLAVGGLGAKRVSRLQHDATAAGMPVHAYAAGRVAAPAAAPAIRPQAGGNFAVTLSYGDVTIGGVGTTTYVCGGSALAFGHPMDLAGPVTYGANDATSLGIVTDNTLGSFKMANIGGLLGTVDQDRTTAVRANLTRTPSAAVVTTTVLNADTHRSRTGSTSVPARDLLPGLLPYAVWANYDTTFDEYGDGRATASWTISGTRGGGRPFSLTRTDKWADRYDISFLPALDVADAADAIVNNDFEAVTIDTVTFNSSIGTQYRELNLTKVEVAVNGGAYKTVKSLRVKAGDKLSVRSTVLPFRSTTPLRSVTTLTVPKSARGQDAELAVAGGNSLDESSGDSECLLSGDCSEDDGPTSLDQVISSITSPTRHDDLLVTLAVDRGDKDPAVVAKATTRQPEVVSGERTIPVSVRR